MTCRSTSTAATLMAASSITRQVMLVGELDAEQRQRLVEIADKCPVHKTLSATPITIQTSRG